MLEPRLLLAIVASSEEFGELDYSVSGNFRGTTTGPNYDDMFSGSSNETGSITYSSPTMGMGGVSGNGSGSGEDTCSAYAFEFAGEGTAIENNGELQRVDGNPTSFNYTMIDPDCDTGGGSLYQIDLEGTFNSETFEASLSGELTQGPFHSSAEWEGLVVFDGGQTDGEIVSGAFDGDTLEYEYVITGQPVKTADRNQNVGEVRAFWADGMTRLAPIHDGVAFHWNARGGTVSVSELGEAPDGANQILVEFDASGQIAEGDGEDNNVFPIPLGIEIESVKAKFDEEDADDVFGKFLPGVRLENEFTVTIGEGAELVTEVIVEVAGIDPAPMVAKKSGSDTQWTFTLDVGRLTADTDIKITAMSDNDLTGKFTGRLKFADKLDLEVKVNTTLDSENVRVIDTVDHAQNFTFLGMLENVPFTNHADKPYQSRLNLYLVEGETEHLLAASFLSNNNPPGIFDVDALGPGEHEIRVKAANEPGKMYRDVDVEIADAEPFSVIAFPAWMGTVADDQKSYNDATSTYLIVTEVPAALQHPLGTTSGTPFELLDGLDTGFGAGAHIIISAPLDTTKPVSLTSEGLFASATLLGQTLIDESVSFGSLNLGVSGTLNPKTLENGVITAKLANPVNLLDKIGDKKLFDVSKSLTLPLPAAFGGTAGAALSLTTAFQAGATRLDFDMSLAIDTATGMLVPTGTYFTFGAGGFANLSAGVDFTIGDFSPIGFSIVSLSVQGFVKVEAAIDVTARFEGPLGSPSLSSVNSQAEARTTVGLNFTSSVFGFETGNVTIDNGDLGINSEWRPLFGGSIPPNEVEQGANLLQQGASLQNGLPAVSPTQGSQFALLGSPRGDATANASLRFASPETGNVTRVGYDFNVLANTANLTPGAHFLETYLIGSEILVDSIDLSTIPLSASANPFGFASGWRSASGQPQAPLAVENSYQLEYRLVSNSATENVAVAIDNLVIESAAPQIEIATTVDDVSDGVLRYVGESDGADAPLALQNTGSVTATIVEILLDNPAFELITPPPPDTVLYSNDLPWEWTVRKVDPNTAGAANLSIVFAEAEAIELRVVFTPVAGGWHNAINRFDVNDDGQVRINDLIDLITFIRTNGIPTDLTSAELAVQAGPPYVDVFEDEIADLRDVLDLVAELRRILTGAGEGEPPAMTNAGHSTPSGDVSLTDRFFAELFELRLPD